MRCTKNLKVVKKKETRRCRTYPVQKTGSEVGGGGHVKSEESRKIHGNRYQKRLGKGKGLKGGDQRGKRKAS